MKQIMLDFSFEGGDSSKGSEMGGSLEKRTRVMIVTTNNLYNEADLENIGQMQGIVDLILTQDIELAQRSNSRSNEKNEGVKKHFILTMHPTAANYKTTLETLALATKLDKLCGTISSRNDRTSPTY